MLSLTGTVSPCIQSLRREDDASEFQDQSSNEVTTFEEHQSLFLEVPQEIQSAIFQLLAINDSVSLGMTNRIFCRLHKSAYESKLKMNDPKVIELFAKTMTAVQIFLLHPECRKDEHVPCDESGFSYLRSIGVGGPLRNREIAEGSLTIDDARIRHDSARKEIYIELLKHPVYYQLIILGRAADGVINYLIDGSLKLEDALKFTVPQIEHLNSEETRKSIDNGSLIIEDAILSMV